MFVRVTQLIHPKSEHDAETCEDASSFRADRGLFVVADGVGTDSFANIWSDCLVQRYVEEPLLSMDPFEVEWWLEHAQECYWRKAPSVESLPMFAQWKAREGSHSTLLALRCTAIEEGKVDVEIVAWGDSCIFIISEATIDPPYSFPLTEPDEFRKRPICLPSRPRNFDRQFHVAKTTCQVLTPGMTVIMATDAVASWILRQSGGGFASPLDAALEVARQTPESWPFFIERCRVEGNELRMVDDDSTALVFTLLEEGEQAEGAEVLGTTCAYSASTLAPRRERLAAARAEGNSERTAVLTGDPSVSGAEIELEELARAHKVTEALHEVRRVMAVTVSRDDDICKAVGPVWHQYAPLLAEEVAAAPLRRTLESYGVLDWHPPEPEVLEPPWHEHKANLVDPRVEQGDEARQRPEDEETSGASTLLTFSPNIGDLSAAEPGEEATEASSMGDNEGTRSRTTLIGGQPTGKYSARDADQTTHTTATSERAEPVTTADVGDADLFAQSAHAGESAETLLILRGEDGGGSETSVVSKAGNQRIISSATSGEGGVPGVTGSGQAGVGGDDQPLASGTDTGEVERALRVFRLALYKGDELRIVQAYDAVLDGSALIVGAERNKLTRARSVVAMRDAVREALKAGDDKAIVEAFKQDQLRPWMEFTSAEMERIRQAQPRVAAAEALQEALGAHDDARIHAAVTALEEAGGTIDADKRERCELASERLDALERLRAALRTGDLNAIIAADVPLLASLTAVTSEEHDAVERARRAKQALDRMEVALAADDDEAILAAFDEVLEDSTQWLPDARERYKLAHKRVLALSQVLGALERNDDLEICRTAMAGWDVLVAHASLGVDQREQIRLAMRRTAGKWRLPPAPPASLWVRIRSWLPFRRLS